ncbi:MAG: exosortase N [Bacteroidota bacterium]
MKFLSQNIKILVALAMLLLLLLNYNIVVFGFNNDFFGIAFSIALFFIGSRKTNVKVNYLLTGFIVILEFITYRLHTQSLHFLSLMLLVCMVYYQFTNKFSFIALFCILLFSTIFNKFFEHLTAEIKQALCNNVYLVLKNFMSIDKIEGVNFYINGSKISIDTACMGLSMFKTGLLTGAVLLTLEEKKQKKYFSVFQIICFCFIIVFLNIISNYFRIITLIVLNCSEENILHYGVGLICFLLYQVAPMLFLIRYFKPQLKEISPTVFENKWKSIFIVFTIVIATSFEMKKEIKLDLLTNLNSKYDIKNGKWVGREVFKIQTPKTLIYIKTPSHKPLICWTGNGYKIIESKEILINNEFIWFNKMEKNNVQYQSLWWYECGNEKYTSYIEVMLMQLIHGKPIRLINETTIIKTLKKNGL